MFNARCYLHVALAIALHQVVLAWRSFDIDFINVTTEYWNPEYMQYHDIHLVPLRNHKAMNISVVLAKELDSFQLEFKVETIRDGNAFQIIDLTVDGCESLETRNVHLLKIIFDEFGKSNDYFPEHCPIQANRPIGTDRFMLSPETFPPYMPDFVFVSVLNLRKDSVYLLKTRTYGSVTNKKNVKTTRSAAKS